LVGAREARQDRVRLHERWRRHYHRVTAGEPAPDCACSTVVVSVPAGKGCDYAVRIRHELRHVGLEWPAALASHRVEDIVDHLVGKRWHIALRYRHQPPSSPLEAYRDRLGFNLDYAIVAPNLKPHPRLKPGLTPNLFGDDEPPGSINGSVHGINRTIDFTETMESGAARVLGHASSYTRPTQPAGEAPANRYLTLEL